jgi:hypothetical protein
VKLKWFEKLDRFPRGPEYESKRKPRGPMGDIVPTGEPSGNARQRRQARRQNEDQQRKG